MSRTLRLRTGPGLAKDQAVAREASGRVVFVEGAAPEEEVVAEVYAEHGQRASARVLEVLSPSPHRVEPRCPHFGACGGCGLQHLEVGFQAEVKAREAVQTLLRIGGGAAGREAVRPRRLEPTWRGAPYGVRSRTRWRATLGAFGQSPQRSHEVLDLSCCPVLEPPLEAAMLSLRSRWHAVSAGPDARLEVHGLTDGEGVWISGLGHGLEPPGGTLRAAPGTPIEVPDAWGRRVVAVEAFGQNHRAGNDAMLAQLDAWLPDGESALELYAGSGNWTRVLRSRTEAVTAVEGDPKAARHIRRSAPGVEVWTDSAERGLSRFAQRRPTSWGLLVNPSRSGFDRGLRRRLTKVGLPGLSWLVYVSCDPGSFARDAGHLASLGLRVEALRVFDLYPQTAHVELMAFFRPTAGA